MHAEDIGFRLGRAAKLVDVLQDVGLDLVQKGQDRRKRAYLCFSSSASAPTADMLISRLSCLMRARFSFCSCCTCRMAFCSFSCSSTILASMASRSAAGSFS